MQGAQYSFDPPRLYQLSNAAIDDMLLRPTDIQRVRKLSATMLGHNGTNCTADLYLG
jgi:hypothetical protein